MIFCFNDQFIKYADVAKLVDAPDLGSGAGRRVGSIPFIRTKSLKRLITNVLSIFFFVGDNPGHE